MIQPGKFTNLFITCGIKIDPCAMTCDNLRFYCCSQWFLVM